MNQSDYNEMWDFFQGKMKKSGLLSQFVDGKDASEKKYIKRMSDLLWSNNKRSFESDIHHPWVDTWMDVYIAAKEVLDE